MNIFIYFWANKIKNVLNLNLNSVEKIQTFYEHLKLKIAIFLGSLNLRLKNVVLIKKRMYRRLGQSRACIPGDEG